MKTNSFIAWLTGLLTLSLAVFSFVLSFNALADLAAQHGISIPVLFPLVVEFAVVIFSLNALYRSLNGESAKVQWALIISASLLAGVFNVVHAAGDLVSQTMAAMPSLFLLLSFETFLGQIKHAVKRSGLNTTLAELDQLTQQRQAELDRLNVTLEAAAKRIEQAKVELQTIRDDIKAAKTDQSSSIEQARRLKAEQDALTIEQRRQTILDTLTNRGDVGASAFAEMLNVSRGTIYNDFEAMSNEGIVTKNGNGWEVV
ncbi:MAG: DUF2637 domain-containing protein [Anaerolineales bacterium]|nr:DUF2637 domain-containing protein [Anaerolineales bacterium]